MRRAFHYTHLETYNKIKRDGIFCKVSIDFSKLDFLRRKY